MSEALSLSVRDVDFSRHTVRVRKGKGLRARTVGIDADAAALVRLWVIERTTLGLADADTLLCTLQGKRLQASYVRQLLPRLAARAGIKKRVHAHGLRHTCAVELSREGVPLHVISAQLGHARASTTSRYIQHLENPELVEAISRRPSWASG